MKRKPVIKVSFNEELSAESNYFIKKLVEKIMIDQLELSPQEKGVLLNSSKSIIDKGVN
ncbi:MAG: hypothetical protein ACQEXE_26050 [Bacillota bacterium]